MRTLAEEGGDLVLHLADGTRLAVDAALVTMGRRPNVADLGLEALGIPLERGIPEVDPETYQIPGTPLFLAGDVTGQRPILHEASDEGRIAGYNAVRAEPRGFQRRTPLAITFSEPGVAIVGESHRELRARGADFVTGRVAWEGQGRAIVKLMERGLGHIYADRATGQLLGAELFAPDAEHLAHLLSWAIASGHTVHRTLSMPFYHPVLEEGLRTALRDASARVDAPAPPLEVLTSPSKGPSPP